MVGLPDGIHACLFDLDGVLTDTARLHAAAWKELFDDFLRARADSEGERFDPFDIEKDYPEYVDGRPRADGVRAFLSARGIAATDETVSQLGSRKNELVLARIRGGEAHAYPGSVRYVEAAREDGLRRAVVSGSANAGEVLHVCGIEELFDLVVDGHVAAAENLRGKPEPDTFLAAAAKLGAAPADAAVFEDALAGVAAGRAGGFGFVVGVDRVGHGDALREHGADIVVTDLSELLDS